MFFTVFLFLFFGFLVFCCRIIRRRARRLHDRVDRRRRPPVLQIPDRRPDGVRRLHYSETRADGPRLLRLHGRAVQHGRPDCGKLTVRLNGFFIENLIKKYTQKLSVPTGRAP